MRAFAVTLTIEPAAGSRGDLGVLDALRSRGMTVELVNGTTRMRIGLPRVSAESSEAAARQAQRMVRAVVPENGYVVSDPTTVEDLPKTPGR